MDKEVLLHVENLKKHFHLSKKQTLKAVNGVSFDIYKGETIGLVGESGCGKTTLGRTIKKIYEATEGQIIFEGQDITQLSSKEKKQYTKDAQMIFQDPHASLNPRLTVGEIIKEGMVTHKLYDKKKCDQKVEELLVRVGLSADHARRFPHEFSGGQRQRIGIARALAVNPKFIVCDEPTSALDVSIQAQVINLLKELQNEFHLTYLFIAHDLSMVKYISDRVGVMYLGQIVELADSDALYERPAHPYTQALMSAIPIPDPEKERNRDQIRLEGELPSPINTPSEGCTFYNRCPYKEAGCKAKKMTLVEVEKGHFATCKKVWTLGGKNEH